MTKDGSTGAITRGNAQEIATRSDHGSWADGDIPKWDNASIKFAPSGKKLSDIVDAIARIVALETCVYEPFALRCVADGEYEVTSSNRVTQVADGEFQFVAASN